MISLEKPTIDEFSIYLHRDNDKTKRRLSTHTDRNIFIDVIYKSSQYIHAYVRTKLESTPDREQKYVIHAT